MIPNRSMIKRWLKRRESISNSIAFATEQSMKKWNLSYAEAYRLVMSVFKEQTNQ